MQHIVAIASASEGTSEIEGLSLVGIKPKTDSNALGLTPMNALNTAALRRRNKHKSGQDKWMLSCNTVLT